MITTDLFIVGGGPAGLATAIAARQRGLDVTVADLRHPPIEKACGEGLMPDGVRALDALGVAFREREATPFAGIRFIADGRAAEGRFEKRHGLGIRRTVLHTRLAEHAAQAGATLHWGKRAEVGIDGSARLDGEAVRCRWIIGADGQDSRVRKAARCTPVSARHRVAVRQHFGGKPWTDFVEVYWHPRGQAYVTPVGDDEVCVALVSCRERPLRIDEMPVVFPEVAEKLAGSAATSAVRGSASASVVLRSVMSKRIALVGDASGSVDAITGDGLSLAFRQALALAEALAADAPSQYRISHRRMIRLPRAMARVLLMVGEQGWLRRRVIGALAARPSAFDQFLAAHGGVISPTSLNLRIIAGFVARLLTAAGCTNPTIGI
jgi:2-polyprenyl-6-methoxyphenol hydroxylase-like FAD-dependent oxidoreductase